MRTMKWMWTVNGHVLLLHIAKESNSHAWSSSWRDRSVLSLWIAIQKTIQEAIQLNSLLVRMAIQLFWRRATKARDYYCSTFTWTIKEVIEILVSCLISRLLVGNRMSCLHGPCPYRHLCLEQKTPEATTPYTTLLAHPSHTAEPSYLTKFRDFEIFTRF